MVRFLGVQVIWRAVVYLALAISPIFGWAWLSDAQRQKESNQYGDLVYSSRSPEARPVVDGRFEYSGPKFLEFVCNQCGIHGFHRLTELRFCDVNEFELDQLNSFPDLDTVTALQCDSKWQLQLNIHLTEMGFELAKVSRGEVMWHKKSTADQ